MREKIYISIVFSLILVFGALWIRYSESNPTDSKLILVEKTEETAPYDLIRPATSKTSNTETPTQLSNTDIISRELFTDFVALSAQGQATSKNLELLANKYVDTIPSLATAEQLALSDFKTVTNTKANFENYASSITQIYSDYSRKLFAVQSSGDVGALFVSQTSEASVKMKNVYQNTASALKALPVPPTLLSPHLELTNLYLENASAMEALSKIQADPASAFAGLLAVKKNIDREAELLIKIQQILTANGI